MIYAISANQASSVMSHYPNEENTDYSFFIVKRNPRERVTAFALLTTLRHQQFGAALFTFLTEATYISPEAITQPTSRLLSPRASNSYQHRSAHRPPFC